MLCVNCNGGSGRSGDDVDRLVGAIAYLGAASVDGSEVELARTRAAALTGTP